MAFQPILDVAGEGTRLFGLEALVRDPESSKLDSVEVLLSLVRAAKAEVAVDRTCVVAAPEAARGLPPGPRLSLNVHARTLVEDEEFPRFVAEQSAARGIAGERLTLDVVQHAAVGAGSRLLEPFQEARRLGFRIALDDVRLTDADQCALVACRPDEMKLDRSLVAGCDADRDRRGLLAGARRMAMGLGPWGSGRRWWWKGWNAGPRSTWSWTSGSASSRDASSAPRSPSPPSKSAASSTARRTRKQLGRPRPER